MIEQMIEALSATNIVFLRNEPLRFYTSLQIGGPVDILAKPTSIREIQTLVELAKKFAVPYAILGNGSNTLVLDEGMHGMVILLSHNFSSIERSGCLITAQAGASLLEVCKYALHQNLAGMEFAYGIPATVGGAMYMNAGAYGGEMKDIVVSCTFLNEHNELETLPIAQLEMRYRHSYFSDRRCIVLQVTFALQPGKAEDISALMEDYMERRVTKQPLEYPSAGSTFKRPANHYASAVIDQCGLKGASIGGAQVSSKHAGFLINANQATSDDILALVDHVKQVVFEKTGLTLECEMKILTGYRHEELDSDAK